MAAMIFIVATGSADSRIDAPGLVDEFRPGTFPEPVRVLIGLGVRRGGCGGGGRRGVLRLRELRDRVEIGIEEDLWGWTDLGGRCANGRIPDPAELSAEGGGEGAVEAKGDFVLQEHMRNQEGQEIDRFQELVVDAESGVNPGPLVVHHPIIAVSKSPEAHGRPFHVGE